jgi:hypothetical protein
MIILNLLYKNGLWISWPIFGLGVFLLWFFIASLVKQGKDNLIHSLPLEARQEVEFVNAGKVVLWLEGPQFTSRFAGLRFVLRGSDGGVLEGRMAPMRHHASGLRKTRLADRVFDLPRPGRYVLHIDGLRTAQAGYGKHRLLFMRPHLLQTVGCILGTLLGALLTIGSLVNFLLRFFG